MALVLISTGTVLLLRTGSVQGMQVVRFLGEQVGPFVLATVCLTSGSLRMIGLRLGRSGLRTIGAVVGALVWMLAVVSFLELVPTRGLLPGLVLYQCLVIGELVSLWRIASEKQ